MRVLVLYWHPKGAEMRLAVHHHLHLLEGRGTAVDCVDEPRPLHPAHDLPFRSLVLRLRSSKAPLSLDLGSALPESGAAAG
jgi:hypothetical protein